MRINEYILNRLHIKLPKCCIGHVKPHFAGTSGNFVIIRNKDRWWESVAAFEIHIRSARVTALPTIRQGLVGSVGWEHNRIERLKQRTRACIKLPMCVSALCCQEHVRNNIAELTVKNHRNERDLVSKQKLIKFS